MVFINVFVEHGVFTVFLLISFSFIAGFIDAVVGGGGLIQLPAMLNLLPNIFIFSIFGTNKISALAGTSMSALHYSKRIKFNFTLLVTISLFAGIASIIGAKAVVFINVNTLKPIIFVVLIAMAFYTYFKKELGSSTSKNLSFAKQIIYGSCLGTIVGFYDGFFGPGTGSFFVLGFVVILGFEFVKASAYSKVINCVTNISALIVFIKEGNFIIELAIILAIFNIAGNILGTKLALKKGNNFVRLIFLAIVTFMIFKYGYDLFIKTI